MPTVLRINKVQEVLKKLGDRYKTADGKAPGVVVGYTAAYAVFVHENLEARHKDGKQAKYLESPARELGPELGKIVSTVTKQTGSFEKGLLIAGLRLQRASQQIVPIDTSALKASAFTALERDLESASGAAKERGEQARRATIKRRENKKAKAASKNKTQFKKRK